MKCKRCGRKLTNSESVKRKHGLRCWNIVQLEKRAKKNDVSNEISFLKTEIGFLKRQIRELREKRVFNYEPIERIQESHKIKRTPNQANFLVVINELKVVFEKENFGLISINPRESIELPPIMVKGGF